MSLPPASAALLLALAATSAHGGEVATADAARKKPLQRCDQLSDKSEIECLQKARERIVEARRKRESAGKAGGDSKTGRADAASTPSKK